MLFPFNSTGNEIQLQFNSSDCFSVFSIFFLNLYSGLIPLITDHLKYSSSLFFMFIKAPIPARGGGVLIKEEPSRGMYTP